MTLVRLHKADGKTESNGERMKRVVIFVVMLAMIAGAAGAKKTNEKPKGSAFTKDLPEIFDWQGQSAGRDVPNWVICAMDGDKAGVKKELKLERDMQVFLITCTGENLDFLKTWAGQVDARAEAASSLKVTIMQTVQTTLQAKNVDKETVDRKAELYGAAAANMTLNGLQKLNSYWIKTRRLKTGIKKAKSDDDYEYKTTYMVVFGIDAKVYKVQLKSAMNDVEDNDKSAPALRSILTEKCTETIETNREEGGGGKGVTIFSTSKTAVNKEGDIATVVSTATATVAGADGQLVKDYTNFVYRLDGDDGEKTIAGDEEKTSGD